MIQSHIISLSTLTIWSPIQSILTPWGKEAGIKQYTGIKEKCTNQ